MGWDDGDVRPPGYETGTVRVWKSLLPATRKGEMATAQAERNRLRNGMGRREKKGQKIARTTSHHVDLAACRSSKSQARHSAAQRSTARSHASISFYVHESRPSILCPLRRSRARSSAWPEQHSGRIYGNPLLRSRYHRDPSRRLSIAS